MPWRERVNLAVLGSPLVAIGAAFIVGIACESTLNWHGGVYLAGIAALLVGWFVARWPDWPIRLRFALLLGAAFLLGGWRMGLDRHALEPDHFALNPIADSEIVTVRGEVEDRPTLRSRTTADFPGRPTDPSSNFTLSASAIRHGVGPWQSCAGRIKVHCAGPALSIEPGTRLERTGILHSIQPAPNPGTVDYRQRNFDSRLFASLWLPSEQDDQPGVSSVPPQSHSRLGAVIDRVRLRGHGLLLGEAEPLTWEDQLLLDDLILGREGDGSRELVQPFLRTGTYHILAISGLHMAILAGVTWVILRLLHVRQRWSAVIVLALVILYCLMAEASPPILRSGIMIAVVCLGVCVRRQGAALTALAVAAVTLLAAAPGAIFEAGFQLSFVVVLGLVLFAAPFYRRLHALVLRADAGISDGGPGWMATSPAAAWCARSFLQAFSVAAVAWIVGLPLTAYYFNRVYPWSIVCSMALGIPVWFALSLSFVKMLISLVLPGLGAWLNGPLHFASSSVLWVVNFLDSLPGMSVTIARPGVVSMVLFYGWLAMWKVRPSWLSTRWMLVLAAAIAVAWSSAGNRRPEQLDVTVLSVGDGLCQVVRTPNDRTLLFDCGSASQTDVAEQVVMPFLASRRDWLTPMTIDAAFLSHPNIDHYNGYPGLARRGLLPGRELLASPSAILAPGQGGEQWQIIRLGRLLAAEGVPLRPGSAGLRRQAGSCGVELLWPPAWADRWPYKFVNDTSQVARVSFAGRRVMFTGDICELAERRLLDGALAGQVDLHADVLVMPHHGGIAPTSDAFIRAVSPQVVIISTRRRADQIVPRCAALRDPGRRVLVTSESGAVTVTIARDGELVCEPHLKR
ncbi:MAG: ComEC/Rec2 family competence protein [Phycisphaerae bacterium]|nr:ComEC/Rec2 family competence protein [Phycisphaerae bacterium]